MFFTRRTTEGRRESQRVTEIHGELHCDTGAYVFLHGETQIVRENTEKHRDTRRTTEGLEDTRRV